MHIWRMDDGARYACTIIEDPSTPDGYRVSDLDPDVADPLFLHKVAVAMTSQQVISEYYEDGDVCALGSRIVHMKEPGHFEKAVRSIPGAALSTVGRV